MSNLSAFLSQNAVKEDNIKHAASKRFLDEKNNPMEWEIKSITSEEDEAIRKECTKKVQIPGKRGQYTQETDYTKYVGKLGAACTVFPNLNDAELQNSYGVMGADALLKTMLKPGEYADYLAKVQEINGFEQTMEDLVDEAKN
jgi:hypothetical protein